ncbi:MAG: hypothetical protein E7335_04615 [Clostridiales bacterium]|nr:hypothetical protein [Clostridiales bacterium]
MEFIKNASALIQGIIDDAVLRGVNAATVSGNYEIDSTILLPSDFSLTLDNCHLRMADGTFCNMFTNASCRTEKGRTEDGVDYNITIRGVGRAILDGGKYNGLSELTSLKDGYPHISVNNVILFTNVNGFKIQNLHVRNQRWWALNFIHCCNGYIGGIDFLADCTRIDENGVSHKGLSHTIPGGYQQILVKNADGIDLRAGCHDIIIENITGFTEDDTVALTGLNGELEKMYTVEGRETDIYNVIIRNVVSSAFCTNVRLLNQSGVKLYNILVDGVFDSSKNSPYMDHGLNGVRIGDMSMYGTRHATEDETYNITVRNVCSRAEYALRIAGAMKDCLFENIRTFDGAAMLANNATVDITGYIKN